MSVLGLLLQLASTEYASVEAAASVRPPVAPIDLQVSLFDLRTLVVTVAAPGAYPEWRTSVHDLRSNPALWRQLHLANWNRIAEPLFHDGLDHLFAHYHQLVVDPGAWGAMTAIDWDFVPQPIRALTIPSMCAYWVSWYGVGQRYGLAQPLVSETLSAIVISESWFDHRAQAIASDGTRDLGLGQTSEYARERMRQLYRRGIVDIAPADDDYFNPWIATRVAAVWFSLMIDEAHGDLDLAMRAYNRGIAAARAGAGTEYRDIVRGRLNRFVRNQRAPAAWNYLWWKAATLTLPARSWPQPHRFTVPTTPRERVVQVSAESGVGETLD